MASEIMGKGDFLQQHNIILFSFTDFLPVAVQPLCAFISIKLLQNCFAVFKNFQRCGDGNQLSWDDWLGRIGNLDDLCVGIT